MEGKGDLNFQFGKMQILKKKPYHASIWHHFLFGSGRGKEIAFLSILL